MWGLWGGPKAPKPDENPSGMQGNKNEANDYRELYPSKI